MPKKYLKFKVNGIGSKCLIDFCVIAKVEIWAILEIDFHDFGNIYYIK